ncbi:hypothetical protein BGZ83_004467 [Gryganskiella cystojenkinii]|nr:hypothetical protein BGZ83_004467 [Gryganskiella cystojenkinii]
MLIEISCASEWIARFFTTSSSTLTPQTVEDFKTQVAKLMQEKYTDHWDTTRPHWGNGYRAITSFGGKVDPLLCQAAQNCSLPMPTLESHIPKDLVLWVEPFSVSFRVGDHGSINTIYDSTRGKVSMRADNSPPTQYVQKQPFGRPSYAARISPPPSPPNQPARVSHAIPITSPLTKSQIITPSATPSPPATKVAIMAH